MRQTGGLPFDEFVLEHGPGLMRTAYLLTLDEHEAEDLLQDCFFQLARRWPKVGSMDNPVAYARRVLVRLVVRGTKQRARRRHELNDESIEIPVTPVAIDQFEARDELRSALRPYRGTGRRGARVAGRHRQEQHRPQPRAAAPLD
jgi:DNA-directed RNA polymerase specialized sigma24 family protein